MTPRVALLTLTSAGMTQRQGGLARWIPLREEWENADSQEERDRIHEEAERIRDEYRNGSGESDDEDDEDDDDDYSPPPPSTPEEKQEEFNSNVLASPNIRTIASHKVTTSEEPEYLLLRAL